MLQAPWETQATPYFPSSQELYLQLADPLLQCPRAFRDGALLGQGGFKAMDDPVCLLDLLFQAQSGLGSAVRKQQSASSNPYPDDALQTGTHFSSKRWHRPCTSLYLFLTLLRITGSCKAAEPAGLVDRNASHSCWAASFSAARL